jgi:Ras GTPase-activating-like protein IQGAP2/3
MVVQHAIHEEVDSATSPSVLANSYPLYMNLAVTYVRPKQIPYVRDTFQAIVRDIVTQEDLELETNPAVVRYLKQLPRQLTVLVVAS